MRRLFLPVLATIVAALLVALGVGLTGSANAAVVNGQSIPQSQVSSDLSAIASSSTYRCYLQASELVRTQGQAGIGPVTGAVPASYSTDFAANWLYQEITNTLVIQAAKQTGADFTTQQASAEAKVDLEGSINSTLGAVAGGEYACNGTASSILASMPSGFVDRAVEAQAASEAVLAHDGGIGLDEDSLRAYYDSHPSDFDTICVSGILLSSQSAAEAVRAKLEAGANFAATAEAESTDSSKSNGGALGCFEPGSANYASVQTDVGNLSIGQVTQPLPSSGGSYVLLTITSRTPEPFDSIVSVVRRTVLSEDATHAGSATTRLLRQADVSVNPLYGSWKRTLRTLGVVPPATPNKADVLNPAANAPTVATAQG